MLTTDSSELWFNNQMIKSKCRKSRHRKWSKRSSSAPTALSSSLSSSMSSLKKQTLNQMPNNKNNMKTISTESEDVRTQIRTIVRNSGANGDSWECFYNCFNSINCCAYRPISYLIELMCRRPSTKSAKPIGDGKIKSSSPYRDLPPNDSPTQQSYKNFNKSSFVSSLSMNWIFNMYSPLLALVIFISFVFRITEACSSRSTPKPRPPSPTTRPNITFQTYACPEAYAKWYCLNGATCFSVRIGESILYNCECADGYMGQRCEFKDLDGSYLPSREKVLVETASIAGGVTIAVLLMVFISILYYTYLRQRRKEKRMSNVEIDVDEVDSRPFSRFGSLKSGSTHKFYEYRQDYSRSDANQHFQDLESGNNLVHNLLRPISLTVESDDRNFDK